MTYSPRDVRSAARRRSAGQPDSHHPAWARAGDAPRPTAWEGRIGPRCGAELGDRTLGTRDPDTCPGRTAPDPLVPLLARLCTALLDYAGNLRQAGLSTPEVRRRVTALVHASLAAEGRADPAVAAVLVAHLVRWSLEAPTPPSA